MAELGRFRLPQFDGKFRQLGRSTIIVDDNLLGGLNIFRGKIRLD